MTDPKNVSRNREFYTEQYGNARPTDREQSVNGSYEASVDIGDEFGSEISTDPNVPSEYQEFFADLPPEHGGPNDGQLMDGFNEQVDGSVPPGAQPIQWGPSQVKEEIEDLLKDNKSFLEEAEAYDSFNDKFKELVRQIGRSGVDPEALMDEMLELKDNITGALEEIHSSNAAKYDAAVSDLESLITKVERSKLPSAEKEALIDRLEDQIDDFKAGKRQNDIFGEVGEDRLKDFKAEINRAIGIDDLKSGFENAVTRIPAKGHAWDKSVELGRRVRDAVESGDWSSVSAYLSELHENDANNVVQQFVGSLFYGPAGKNEEKLNQLLALIPENVRDQMANAALRNAGERLSGENVDSDAKKEEHAYYGNPTVTADRLRRNDIEDSLDSLEQDPASSTTSGA